MSNPLRQSSRSQTPPLPPPETDGRGRDVLPPCTAKDRVEASEAGVGSIRRGGRGGIKTGRDSSGIPAGSEMVQGKKEVWGSDSPSSSSMLSYSPFGPRRSSYSAGPTDSAGPLATVPAAASVPPPYPYRRDISALPTSDGAWMASGETQPAAAAATVKAV